MERRKAIEEIIKAEFGSWNNNRNDEPSGKLARKKREKTQIAKISSKKKGVYTLILQKLKGL